MEKFEKQFEDLDVRTSVSENNQCTCIAKVKFNMLTLKLYFYLFKYFIMAHVV